MITKYGFSSIGPVNISQNNEDIFLGNSLLRNKSTIADKTSLQIDNEIMKIAKNSLNKSFKILERNRILLDKLVELLIHEETVNKEKFIELASKFLNVWLNKIFALLFYKYKIYQDNFLFNNCPTFSNNTGAMVKYFLTYW